MNLLSAPSARASGQTSSVIHQQQQRVDNERATISIFVSAARA